MSNKRRYLVRVPFTTYKVIEVKAHSHEEAVKAVAHGGGVVIDSFRAEIKPDDYPVKEDGEVEFRSLIERS